MRSQRRRTSTVSGKRFSQERLKLAYHMVSDDWLDRLIVTVGSACLIGIMLTGGGIMWWLMATA
jgi:hypothetical protein